MSTLIKTIIFLKTSKMLTKMIGNLSQRSIQATSDAETGFARCLLQDTFDWKIISLI